MNEKIDSTNSSTNTYHTLTGPLACCEFTPDNSLLYSFIRLTQTEPGSWLPLAKLWIHLQSLPGGPVYVCV